MKSLAKLRFTFKPTLHSSLLSLVCVVGLCLVGGYLAVRTMHATLARWEATRIAERVRHVLKDLVSEDVWKEPSSRRSAAFFERFAESKTLKEIENFRRIKVWDPTGMIVWSDGKKLIGTRPTEQKVRKALAGTVVFEFKSPGHRPAEREGYRDSPIMETYVPVWREGRKVGGQPNLVVEVYTEAPVFFENLRAIQVQVWTMTSVGGLAVYLIMLGAVRLSGRLRLKADAELEMRVGERNAVHIERLNEINRRLSSLTNVE